MHRTHTWLVVGGGLGVLSGLAVPVPAGGGIPMHVLVGWVVGSFAFSLPLLGHLLRQGVDGTRTRVEGTDASRTVVDLVVVLASLASLVAIGVMLVPNGTRAGTLGIVQAVLTLASVAGAWVAVHTIYTLRYARFYFNAQPGCIEFDGVEVPRFSDFAYLAFTLGMTYQVSDTALRSSEIRRMVLHHTLLSYVYGTGFVAATINLVVGLAQSTGPVAGAAGH